LSAFAMRFLMKFGMSALKKVLGSALKKFNDLLQTKFPDNPVSNKLCDWGFEPVDIARGKVMTSREDFALPGPIPLVWECIYYSNTRYIDGPLGARWSHSYDMYLETDIIEEIPVIKLRMSDGRLALFPQLELGESYHNRQEKLELFKDENGFFLRNADRLYYRFEEKGERWRLLHIKDTSDNTILFDYDEQGALKKITDSVGRELQVDTDAFNRILSIHVPHPTTKNKTFPIIRYEYDKEGDLIAAYNAHDNAFRYKYHKHLMTQLTYRDGLSFYYEYDSEEHTARCIHTYGDGDLYKGNLHYEEGKTTIERIVGHPDGHTDTYTEIYYHDGAVVHHKIDALGNETKYEYNEFYELQSETDPLGYKTSYKYDDRSNLIETTYPDNTQRKMTYSDGDLLLEANDQVGGKWKWEYDDKERLIRRTNCVGRAIEYKYNEKGLLTQITDPMGSRTLIGYNKSKEPDQITLPNNSSTRLQYDYLGRRKVVIDSKGNIQRRTFDLLGNIARVQEPNGNVLKLKYDEHGNITHAKDKQKDISFKYTGLGELKTRIENDTKVEFEYDTDERLTAIVNEHGEFYKFHLNANGKLEFESGFDGLKCHYKRDAADRVIKTTKSSDIESFYQYDSLGRMLQRVHSNGEIEHYFYREDGRLMRAVNDVADVIFERDIIGNVITETQNGYQLHSEYDAMGSRIRLSSSLGLDLAITRDIMGDVSGMRTQGKTPPWEMELKLDIMGLEVERLMPGGVKSKWDRDRLGRPIHHHIFGGDGKAQRSRAYEWDVNNRLKRFIDFGKDVTQFQHDKLGNLTAAIYPNGNSQYRNPDAIGNLFRKLDKNNRKYGPAGQLLESEGIQYDYDVEGNLIKKTTVEGEVWQYKWNAAGMLEKVIRPDKKEVIFTYDALSRRTTKTYEGNTTHWIWDANVPVHEWQTPTTDTIKNTTFTAVVDSPPEITDDDEIVFIEKSPTIYNSDDDTDIITIEEVTTTSKTTRTAVQPFVIKAPVPTNIVTWLFEPDSFAPIAKLTKDKQYSIQTDHLGTPVSMYDEAGYRTWGADVDTYGRLNNLKGNKLDCPFRFPGQYEDIETGLYYNRFRYYDTNIGSYISQDPIGLMGNNPNFYAYVHDTNIFVDIFGLHNCSKNAKILRENMIEEGFEVPPFKNSAHHIIMSGSKDPRMKALRKKMKELGIDINAGENGVFLPTSSKAKADAGVDSHAHSKVHTNTYKQNVYDELININDKGKFQEKLIDIGDRLSVGDFVI